MGAWATGQFLFVFSSTSFFSPWSCLWVRRFLLSSSSECNPSLCIFAHLASPLFVSSSASYPPSPFIHPLIQCRHGEAVEPCIDKIFDLFLFSLSGVLSSLFSRSFRWSSLLRNKSLDPTKSTLYSVYSVYFVHFVHLALLRLINLGRLRDSIECAAMYSALSTMYEYGVPALLA